MTGKLSRFTDAHDTLWLDNPVPDAYEFKMQEGACFDPDSDLRSPSEDRGVSSDDDYSYAYYDVDVDDDGFFCPA